MALTAQEAIQLLTSTPSTYNNEAALLSLVKQVSVETTGSVTLAYSGKFNEVDSGDIKLKGSASQ